MKKCKKCGMDNVDSVCFCKNCGEDLGLSLTTSVYRGKTNMCCPGCGSKKLQVWTNSNTTISGSNYSAGKGCLGYLLLGPFGLLCGLCGKGQTITTTNKNLWICSDCGVKFENPSDIRTRINEMESNIKKSTIISAIIPIVFFIVFSGFIENTDLLFVIGAICSAIFAVLTYNTINKSIEESKFELSQLERGMRRFEK